MSFGNKFSKYDDIYTYLKNIRYVMYQLALISNHNLWSVLPNSINHLLNTREGEWFVTVSKFVCHYKFCKNEHDVTNTQLLEIPSTLSLRLRIIIWSNLEGLS